MDRLLARFPGSPQVKAAAASATILGLLAIPVFKSSEGRQGHDYFSQEKPEAVRAGQEAIRKEYRALKKKERGQQE